MSDSRATFRTVLSLSIALLLTSAAVSCVSQTIECCGVWENVEGR